MNSNNRHFKGRFIYFPFFLKANTFHYLLPLLIIFSCSEKNTEVSAFPLENGIKFEDKVSLEKARDIGFPLDSETGLSHYSIRVDSINSGEYLSFINVINQSLYVYDLSNQTLKSKIKLSIEGPNGLGDIFTAVHLLLEDGRVLIYNDWTGFLYIINRVTYLALYPLKINNLLISHVIGLNLQKVVISQARKWF